MTPELLAFVRDLAAVLEKHKGGLTYTTNDDGIHAFIGEDFYNQALLGFLANGSSPEIKHILRNDA